MKRILFLLVVFPLIACQSNYRLNHSPSIPIESLYSDQYFDDANLYSIESEQEIFQLDEDMIYMVENTLNTTKDSKKKALKLLRHIFSQEKIALSYSSNANLTASQAYHSQTANCMSLTIMAYALAKEANLDIVFQEVDVPEYWIRNRQYNLLTGHVNLLITPKVNHERKIIFGSSNIEIDFDPYVVKQEFRKKVIKKNTVLAMFYNNKGGQALVNENYDLAYRYLKAATVTDKKFSAAWGNLAVLYRLTDQFTKAENAYRYAIQVNSNNLTALTNLAILLRSKENIEEAEQIDRMLYHKRAKNPYYYAVLADEAYYNHDYQEALKHYKKGIKLNSKIHELHFGLAKVYYQMNRLAEAEKAMKNALKFNKTNTTERQYIAKLNFLQAEIAN